MVVAKQKSCRFSRSVGRIQSACFPDTIFRKPRPKFLRFVELNECPAKLFRLIGDENILAIGESHAFYSERRCDYGHAERHTLIDFTLHSGPKPQRRNG